MILPYLPAVIWIVLLVFVLTRHVRVYRLYDSQLKIVRQIEQAGAMEDGSTLVAINQRVRYIVRIGLAVAGILIGALGVFATYDKSFGSGIFFGIVVIAYFYASEIATGYLTIRDERVIGKILDIDTTQRNASMERNTEAVERNTEAMDRAEAGQADRAERADVLAGNTEAVDANTHAVQKNTESRSDGD